MIGQNIKRLRELKGWSQETLARKMGYKSKLQIRTVQIYADLNGAVLLVRYIPILRICHLIALK